MNKTLKIMSLGALLASPVTQSYDSNDYSFGAAAIGIGLAAVAVGALTYACTYEESIEAIIEKTETLLDKGRHYEKDITLIERYGNLNNPLAISEDGLYQITGLLTKKNSSYYYANETTDALSGVLSELRTKRTLLEKRMHKLQVERKAGTYVLVERIESTIQRVDIGIAYLQRLYAFIKEHKAYMNLFEKEVAIYTHYEQVLKIVEHEGSNSHTAAARVTHILGRAYQSNRYPYIEAAVNIRKVASELKNKLAATSTYAYPQRTAWARRLLENLDTIESMISTSPDIQHDKMRKEQDRIQEERRKLEQERVRVEREREAMAYERRKAERATQDLRDAARKVERATEEQERAERRYHRDSGCSSY